MHVSSMASWHCCTPYQTIVGCRNQQLYYTGVCQSQRSIHRPGATCRLKGKFVAILAASIVLKGLHLPAVIAAAGLLAFCNDAIHAAKNPAVVCLHSAEGFSMPLLAIVETTRLNVYDLLCLTSKGNTPICWAVDEVRAPLGSDI